MVALDYVVLVSYFLVLAAIGFWAMRRVKVQEDFFMGGRSFGKVMQTFAAFGAGTGSSDPVNTARTTFTSGMSGMWSVMYWLFVTPFYWITGVWYRRMRHLTLGDWFVERYDSRSMGAAFAVFGVAYYVLYGSMLFSAIGKVAAPLIEFDTFTWGGSTYGIEYLLVPLIGLMVLIYGIAGGLRAAYYTDLIQGSCIILLSIILVPYGLHALVEKFGDPSTQGVLAGFEIMHRQLPAEHFFLIGTGASEFPLHRIVAVVVINLIGIVVTPHMIATGGGSAKTEMNARMGLVMGNFLKRFCTIGWVLTALIALALYADHAELVEDPDRTWGVASRELLGPGLTGLMLACLLAALMSSIDAYMIVCSALVVRNIYAPYYNPQASERECLLVGRAAGVLVVIGAVVVSLVFMNVFEQLRLTWVFPILFAAIFWVGMYWRRATAAAAWVTLTSVFLVFFLLPVLLPYVTDLRHHSEFLQTTRLIETTTVRRAAASDVAQRRAAIAAWDRTEADQRSTPRPAPLAVGDPVTEKHRSGGTSIYWTTGVVPLGREGRPDPSIQPVPVGESIRIDDNTTKQELRYPDQVRLQGVGNFRLEFLLYRLLGINLTGVSSATLETLELPLKIVLPFLVMIGASLITPRGHEEVLDRYYTKMRTPVIPDPEQDRENLELAYARRHELERRKLWPGSSLEFNRPTTTDAVGFVVSFAICFAIIGLAVLVARIGS